MSLSKEASKIARHVTTCSELQKTGEKLRLKNSGKVEIRDTSSLPYKIRKVAESIAISKASKPIRTPAGFLVLMVCKRNKVSNPERIRAKIKQMLLEKKAMLTDRRMLRNARRSAFLDIRR